MHRFFTTNHCADTNFFKLKPFQAAKRLIDKNYNVIIKPDTYYSIAFDNEQENLIYAYTDPMVFFGDIFRITEDGLLKITPEPCYYVSHAFQSNNDAPLSNNIYNFNEMGMMTLRNKNNEFMVVDINGNIVMPFTKSYFTKRQALLL